MFRLSIVVLSLCLISILDVAGVVLMGVLASVLIGGQGVVGTPSTVAKFLSFLNLENQSIRAQAISLGLLILVSLISKSLLSILLTWRMNIFFSHRIADMTKNFLDRVFQSNQKKFREFSNQEIIASVIRGPSAIYLKLLSGSINMIVDVFLLCAIFVSLFFVDVYIMITSLTLFFSLGYLVYSVTYRRVHRVSRNENRLQIDIYNRTSRLLESFKSVLINGNPEVLTEEIRKLRVQQAKAVANLSFLPTLNKYVFEIASILIIFFFAAISFVFFPPVLAFGYIATFLAATTRIAPALSRIQQSTLQIRSATGLTELVIRFYSSFSLRENFGRNTDISSSIRSAQQHRILRGIIEISDLTYASDRGDLILENVNLRVNIGDKIGVVGESGSGKTTLMELILGLIPATRGTINVDGSELSNFKKLNPGAFAYVPQEVYLVGDTLRENIRLGRNEYSDDDILQALASAGLSKFILDKGDTLELDLSDTGRPLSGGELQRIGIARALLGKPRILILDEATSALDSQTEKEIIQELSLLSEDISIFFVTHRKDPLKNLDKILTVENRTVRKMEKR